MNSKIGGSSFASKTGISTEYATKYNNDIRSWDGNDTINRIRENRRCYKRSFK